MAPQCLRIGRFTSVNPLVVHINGFHEIIDRTLIGLTANGTSDSSTVPLAIQFHFAGPFMVAKGAVEHSGQRFYILLLWRSFSFTLPFSHSAALAAGSKAPVRAYSEFSSVRFGKRKGITYRNQSIAGSTVDQDC